jgi:hypothetical protein
VAAVEVDENATSLNSYIVCIVDPESTQPSAVYPRSAAGSSRLLGAPDFARKLRENGHDHVRENFLLTRHMRDYLVSFLFVADGSESDVINL